MRNGWLGIWAGRWAEPYPDPKKIVVYAPFFNLAEWEEEREKE
jgi:hypothetical protein